MTTKSESVDSVACVKCGRVRGTLDSPLTRCQIDPDNFCEFPSVESTAADSVSNEPSQLRKLEIEEKLEKVALGGLANIYYAITGKECEKYIALGMATSAVSSLLSERDALIAERDALRAALNKAIEIVSGGLPDYVMQFREPILAELRALAATKDTQP